MGAIKRGPFRVLGSPGAPDAFKSTTGQQDSSSTGRASVSKTEGWGFESLLSCHYRAAFILPGHAMDADLVRR